MTIRSSLEVIKEFKNVYISNLCACVCVCLLEGERDIALTNHQMAYFYSQQLSQIIQNTRKELKT